MRKTRKLQLESLETKKLMAGDASVAIEGCTAASADIDGDGQVAFSDFLQLSKNFGQETSGPQQGDLNCSGAVDFADFLILAEGYGDSVEPTGRTGPTDATFLTSSNDQSPEDIRTLNDDDPDGMRPSDLEYRAHLGEVIWLSSDNVIVIQGSGTLDKVTIEESIGRLVEPSITVAHEDPIRNRVTTETFDRDRVEGIFFDGEGFADQFYNYTSVPSEVHGGDGDDIIIGGSGDDVLYGGHGEDAIEGNEGSDTIEGNGGPDTIKGGDGVDNLYGNAGNDTIEGGEGGDFIWGGTHHDVIEGGPGADKLYGDGGDDSLDGGQDRDELKGGEGNDLLEGGAGADDLFGEDGDDSLFGGDGIDHLRGNDGNDGLWGGAKADILTGGVGADRYLMHEAKDVDDVITGKTSEDVEVVFEDGDSVSVSGVSYDAGTWSYDNMVNVDEAFAMLVDQTDSNDLLRRHNGNELTFIRVGAPDVPTKTAAWNKGSHEVTLTDLVFDTDDPKIHHIVFHEIAHNWDTKRENDFFEDFRHISWNQNLLLNWVLDENTEGFVTDYAMTEPKEDWAEHFAAFLMQENGETVPGEQTSLDDLPQKEAQVDAFFASF